MSKRRGPGRPRKDERATIAEVLPAAPPSADEATFSEELLEGALEALQPIRNWTVSDWAEAHIRFGSADSHLSDRPDFKRIGKLDRHVLEMVKSLECEKIVDRSGTQSGKTTKLIMAAAYWLQNVGTNGMWLLPTMELVDRVPRNRIIPTLRKSLIACDKGETGGATLKQATFHGGQTVLRFLLANEQNIVESPAALVLVDEPEEMDSKGFDLLQLAESRFRTFKSRRQIVIAGTPKRPAGTGGIIDHYDQAKRFIPEMACPRCGCYTVWEFKDFHWAKDGDADPHYGAVLDGRFPVWAECPECSGRVEDAEWGSVWDTARWRDLDPDRSTISVGYWKRAYETAFETPRTVVAEYIKTKDNPLLRKAFLNSWLGEVRTDENDDPDAFVAEKRGQIAGRWGKGMVPAETQQITWGIDVGSPVSHAVGVAWLPGGVAHVFWSEHMNSAMSEWRRFDAALGHLQTMNGLDFEGQRVTPRATGIDSGYNTSEIYKLCTKYKMLACKGSNVRMTVSHRFTQGEGGVGLILHDHFHWQSYLDAAITGGRLTVAHNESDRFFNHLANERLIHASDAHGRVVQRYEKVAPRAPNHFRDALVLALMVGSLMGYDQIPGNAGDVRLVAPAAPADDEPEGLAGERRVKRPSAGRGGRRERVARTRGLRRR